jgi:hypothetical protein
MRGMLALLAIAVSVTLIGWIALRDPKRVRAQDDESALRAPLTSRQRRLLALAAATPGPLLMLGGWWSSTIMWIGATVTLAWLWVVWLSRTRRSSPAAPDEA